MSAPLRVWHAGPLPERVGETLARLASTSDVRRVVALPDVHLAEDVCVGVALATNRRIFPQAVGGDIGCGMLAVGFDGEAAALSDGRTAARLLKALALRIPAVRHRTQSLPDVLPPALSDASLDRVSARDGRVEFATLGRGNHFLELQSDDDGRLWLMVHSGSRAMGPAVRDHHLRRAASDGLRFLEADSPEGRAYLRDHDWAVRYAEASREAMAAAAAEVVRDVLGCAVRPATAIRCLHNHVRREEGQWVHRKGALSARDGEPGVIPGSMGTPSYHVVGRGCGDALWSSSHGAGRRMSRGQARARIRRSDLEREMSAVWFDYREADRLRDEAPSAYKDIEAVLRAQKDLTRIVRRLRPVLSYKGS